MPQTIQCPTCAKKFRLPDRPPATFTCTTCATVMDLSGFRAAAPAVPAATATATSAAGGTALEARRSSSSRSSAKRGGSGSSTRARRGARDDGDADDDDGGGRRGSSAPKKSNALLIGSLIGVVVVGGLAFLLLRKKQAPPTTPVAGAGTGATPPADTARAGHSSTTGTEPVSGASASSTSPTSPTSPTSSSSEPAPTSPDAPKETGPAGFVPPGKVRFEPIDHHPDATPEERTKIDSLIQLAVFENAGSDSRSAGNELVAIGMKAAPRLINVFTTVKMGEGFEDRMGKIKVSVAEGLLRRIDGYIERKLGPSNTPLKPQSDTRWVEKCARIWISWWVSEKWKSPEKPWDERLDGRRDDSEGGGGMSSEPRDGDTGK